jgi:hypothetical protein
MPGVWHLYFKRASSALNQACASFIAFVFTINPQSSWPDRRIVWLAFV